MDLKLYYFFLINLTHIILKHLLIDNFVQKLLFNKGVEKKKLPFSYHSTKKTV